MKLLAMAKVHTLGLTSKPTFSFYDIRESIFFKKFFLKSQNLSLRTLFVKEDTTWDKNQNHFCFLKKIVLKI